MMIILNFAHPLSDIQKGQIETIAGEAISRVFDIPSYVELDKPLRPQIEEKLSSVGHVFEQEEEWIVIVPPSLNFSAVILIAILRERMGFVPPCVRPAPVQGAMPPRFEVAEIIFF